MTKPSMDDQFDLIELIKIFWHHRIKFIVMALLGLILGLIFTFTHERIFSTDFKFFLGHPIIKNSTIIESSILQGKLNESELNKDILPNYSYDNRKRIYTVKSKTAEIQTNVESLLKNALAYEFAKIKESASSRGFSENQLILNATETSKIIYTREDITNLKLDDILSSFKINFSKTKSMYPLPFKHGLTGVFIGLILGFVWMILAIIISKMNVAYPKRKA